ncbi:phosphohistidine phosphatase SixA [Massilia terrae]|uniref:Histidine phosphatase family protein n=1 Tax=Massilia terrae TaxID=1811224 RepID=A0ABT2CZB5_9BURK|nr:histidine phosphatase family protein [Massilia terrae]MCS0659325.1 histidine phosphatase family protein [Massilia terrae]
MDLVLWRHAEAHAARPGEDDGVRVLTSKGRRHAARVGAWLDRQLPAQCRIVSSPALRCRQTAEALGRKFHLDVRLALDASAARMLDAAGWPDGRGAVVLVGHQPLLGQAAALVLCGQPFEWKVPKASVLWLGCKGDGGAPFIRLAAGPDLVARLR